MSRFDDMSDEELGRQLAAELPRRAAPAHLRRAILAAARPARRASPVWLGPAVGAMAAVLVLGLFFIPALPRLGPTDPAERLVRAVIAEHTRTIMWGARRTDIVPAALPSLTQETGIGLARVFVGDDHLTLVGAEPVYLDNRRGVAIHYRDADGHLVTYVAVPAPHIAVPDRKRVQADRFRPALVRDESFSTWLWRQGDLACLLVSDMVSDDDVARFKDYFVRVRLSTEPFSIY